tara:strand:+ start:1445 stop:1684 length:240 start_codon:yes stop_codon:yes gene_type:complete
MMNQCGDDVYVAAESRICSIYAHAGLEAAQRKFKPFLVGHISSSQLAFDSFLLFLNSMLGPPFDSVSSPLNSKSVSQIL